MSYQFLSRTKCQKGRSIRHLVLQLWSKDLPFGAGSTILSSSGAVIYVLLSIIAVVRAASRGFMMPGGSDIVGPATIKRSSHSFIFPMDQDPQGRSTDELRQIIEEGVLRLLQANMREHSAMVKRGERHIRPFVTVTYAQSIDGSIAAADKSQGGYRGSNLGESCLPVDPRYECIPESFAVIFGVSVAHVGSLLQVLLSGMESRFMTHGLRSIHDAILVGAGTVRQDNPRLNVRYWPPESSSEYLHGGTDTKQSRGGEAIAPSPRAVVLADNQNRLPRVMRLRGAVIFANLASPEAWRWLTAWRPRNQEGFEGHTADNFVVVHCRRTADGRCDLGDCLDKLYAMGFKSVMVEGGAAVISSFLRGLGEEDPRAEPITSGEITNRLVNSVVVTITPTFLRGYNVLSSRRSHLGTVCELQGFPLELIDVSYVRLGQDMVLIGTPVPPGNQ